MNSIFSSKNNILRMNVASNSVSAIYYVDKLNVYTNNLEKREITPSISSLVRRTWKIRPSGPGCSFV